MIKKYSSLKKAEWYSNPILNGVSVPEEGSKKAAAEKQSDEFFQEEFHKALEESQKELISEFNRKGALGIKDKKNPEHYKYIISKSPTNPKMLRITIFQNGEPVGHSDYNFNKSGLIQIITEYGIASQNRRKDLPDWAGLGNVEPLKTFYRLKLRDISPGTVPPGFVETKGNRTVVYDRLLSSKEISDYELVPLGYEDSYTRFEK